MRLTRVAWTGGVLAAVLTTVAAQQTTKPDFETATLAWDRGDYVTALTAYRALLSGPGGEKWLEPIALQTGELFQTRELTSEGASPRFSPDGRFVAFEAGGGPGRLTRIVEPGAEIRVVAEVKGFGLAFLPQGDRVVYLKPQPSDELTRAQAELDNAGQAPARFTAQQRLNWLQFKYSDIVTRDLATGQERVCPIDGLLKSAVVPSADGRILYVTGAREDDPSRSDVYGVAIDCDRPVALTKEPGYKTGVVVDPRGAFLLYTPVTANPFASPASDPAGGAGPGARRGGGRAGQPRSFATLDLKTGSTSVTAGSSPALSADGATLAYVSRSGEEGSVMAGPPGGPAVAVKKTRDPLGAIAVSPDGSRIAFQAMPRDDWEVFVIGRDGSNELRVTREIQHDVSPRFVTNTLLLAATGEARHLRSSLYDLQTLVRTRLFHNNTVRTIAPEYAWVPSPNGRQVLVVAERDGDTVSPERGLYLVPLDRRVTVADVLARIDASLTAERDLRTRGERMFRPILPDVTRALAEVSTSRIYGYEKALFDFDSKHVSKPGNRLAGEYLFNAYRSFGYEPEYQWFEPRGALGGKSANVIATLRGTENPDLVYVVSSHYDSNAAGPGGDDDSSATAALLEAARVLAKRPMPATVVFASFTGEESGLLGSREFVRRAQEQGVRVVGALNNDMVGWANDHRLDNTIRYSNAGIRDVQHAASFLTKLITYDALYFKATDAASYFEAYGDIVGGIGSYPVLGNPHYHQPTDLLDTVNHDLVAETSRVTVASIMLLASSPSRVKGLRLEPLSHASARVGWTASPEKGVTGYVVAWGPAADPFRNRVRVVRPPATISGALPGTVVSVKAVNARGLEGWDWARTTVGAEPQSPTLDQVKNLTYTGIYDAPITLTNGRYEGPPFVKDSPLRPRAGVVEALVERADLDQDGKAEAAVVLWESSGASGNFVYLAIVGERGGRPVNVATARIGDRVQIRSMAPAGHRVVMEVVAHGPGEPMCCPTQKQRRTWEFAGGSLTERPMEVTGTVGPADLEGKTWTLTGFDGDAPVPPGVEVTLIVQGARVAGTSGCNKYTGTIEAGEGARGIRIGPLVSTRMACPPPRDAVEAKYLAALQHAFQFSFTGGSLALAYKDGDAVRALRFTGKAPAPAP